MAVPPLATSEAPPWSLAARTAEVHAPRHGCTLLRAACVVQRRTHAATALRMTQRLLREIEKLKTTKRNRGKQRWSSVTGRRRSRNVARRFGGRAAAPAERSDDVAFGADDRASHEHQGDADVLEHGRVDPEEHRLPEERKNNKEIPKNAKHDAGLARHRVPKKRLPNDAAETGTDDDEQEPPIVTVHARLETRGHIASVGPEGSVGGGYSVSHD
mmetsp:Transcript_20178/g.62683  ORF Transcript_20178/g.62683 Transcript_20178/m.62683 type:complete len:215 (+) Transcript_20178:209-853(+)